LRGECGGGGGGGGGGERRVLPSKEEEEALPLGSSAETYYTRETYYTKETKEKEALPQGSGGAVINEGYGPPCQVGFNNGNWLAGLGDSI
jgi:hypothetical protein